MGRVENRRHGRRRKDMLKSLNKLTSRFERVLENSRRHALNLGKKEVEVDDIFWSLTQSKGSMAREVLTKSGLNSNAVSNLRLNVMATSIKNSVPVDFSSQVKKTIERSVSLASDMHHLYVGTEHLLFALLDSPHKEMTNILSTYKIDKKKIMEQLKIVFQSTLNFGEVSNIIHKVGQSVMTQSWGAEDELSDEIFNALDEGRDMPLPLPASPAQEILKVRPQKTKDKKAKAKLHLLEHFGRNLCDEQTQKTIDPVIGREQEIDRIIQILCRRTKNNPVLLGDPGVGKTAIVEGLAKKIIQGDVPDVLLNKKIYSLDMNLMVAGAIMRGEFEARLKQVIDEVKNNPEIIIFIDELHNVVGAGSITGTMDAANILKPALARGELRCIGATTFNEYKKHIEEDAALERRFQAVQVAEPSLEEAIAILQGIKEYYEKHHRVRISDQAIEAAVDLSIRYLPEKFLPDKAIDLIDEAAARLKVKSGVVDEDLRKWKLLESKVEALYKQKQDYVRQENYPAALKLKEEEAKIFNAMSILEDKMALRSDKWLGMVQAKDVAQIVSEITKIPLENLITSSRSRILNLERVLSKKIIGQPEVLKELAFYLKRARAGLSGQNRPLGSFMFLGPSGVGKTETAKVLAEQIFSGPNKKGSLVRLDMSEFAESFNVSRMIGSPAGYVGYKEGGRLTEAVRRNPYSVVLFDEIEKAHPEAFNVLLQILDEGYLNDATGKQVNFRNTIIVLTSNLGTGEYGKTGVGFGDLQKDDGIPRRSAPRNDIMTQVREKFRPEFLNRLDKIMIFKPLDIKSVEKIVYLQLYELAYNLAKNKKVKLSWPRTIIAQLAKLSYSPESGARNVRRTIERMVENELADKILAREIKAGDEVRLGWVDNQIVIGN